MNARLHLTVSLGLNAALAAVLWQFHTWPRPAPRPVPPARLLRLAPTAVLSLPPAPISPPVAASPPVPPFRWEQLVAPDFCTYRDNLRAVGCPENTVRDILQAEINDEYLRRRQPLIDALQPRFWDRLAKGEHEVESEGETPLRALRREYEALVEAVLGEDPALTQLRATSRQRQLTRQYGWLPDPLQTQLRELDERFQQDRQALIRRLESVPQEIPSAAELNAQLARLRTEFEAAREDLLGEGASEFKLRTDPAANWASRLAGFEPTEAEWRTIAQAQLELDALRRERPPLMDVRLLMRYGLLPKGFQIGSEDLRPPTDGQGEWTRAREEALAKAQAQFEATVRSTLGPERYAAYELADHDNYQQTRRVTHRLGLDDAVAREAFEIQRAAQAAAQQLQAQAHLDAAAVSAGCRDIQTEASRALEAVLGSRGFATYTEYAGDWLRSPASP